jgi:hypothetical protein
MDWLLCDFERNLKFSGHATAEAMLVQVAVVETSNDPPLPDCSK